MLPEVTSDDRVLVAMSGGVDSSVAAARLADAGHDVVGVTLYLSDHGEPGPAEASGPAAKSVEDARKVAAHLGIEHHTLDRRRRFEQEVVRPFVEGYLAGRTPSPCVFCNRHLKLPEVLDLADRLGARAIATGHYARLALDRAGTHRLYRGRDRRKDQSYFLVMLEPGQLARLQLPLGDALKSEVRSEAHRRGLPVADKGESQELCFVGEEGYARLIERRAAGRIHPGAIETTDGRVVGQHRGIHRFTCGQRRGLGIALGYPAFVTEIDAVRNVVRVGTAAEASATAVRLVGTRWHGNVLFPIRALLKVRSQHEGIMTTIQREGGTGPQPHVVAHFDGPVRGVAPGQVAVAYREDCVLGGGTIAEAWRGSTSR